MFLRDKIVFKNYCNNSIKRNSIISHFFYFRKKIKIKHYHFDNNSLLLILLFLLISTFLINIQVKKVLFLTK